MGKFNKSQHTILRTGGGGPVTSSPTPDARNSKGAAAFTRDARSELFLLAVSNFTREETHHETGLQRDTRITELAQQVVAQDARWLLRCVPWLREVANMRSVSVMLGIEGAKAMVANKIPGGRRLIDMALARADEPEEAIAYWVSSYGQRMPHAIKRGIGDAVSRLYTQRAVVRYDNNMDPLQRPWTFGGVIDYVGPAAISAAQVDLFKYLVTKSKRRSELVIPDSLDMIIANKALQHAALSTPDVLLNATRVRLAGMRWQDVKSLAGKRVPAKALWTSLIANMGYMAKLRNLRNFDEAGLDRDLIDSISAQLSDPAEVADSRQLPMRFLAAHREVKTHNWSLALERALELSLRTVPRLPGRTLVLIDTSYSMNDRLSEKSTLQRWDAAVIFGLAQARACETADVVSFSSTTKVFPKVPGESLLRSIDRWKDTGFFINSNTATRRAVQDHYRGHDNVVIVTDEECDTHSGSDVVNGIVPDDKLTVTFNLAGYKTGHMPSGHSPFRVTVGGLSDAAFLLIPALRDRAAGAWPF